MTREEQLACLEDRPCSVCKFHTDRCNRWTCVFEDEPEEQEPCEDCISRAEAINAISHAELSFQVESDLNFKNYKREVQEIADGILKGQVKAISDLPSIQPKPKTEWIPVNKRLPEPYQNILVTSEVFHWVNEPIKYSVEQRSFGGIVDFIAWMPLPEPYEPADSEKE